MLASARIVVDENIPRSLIAALRSAGPEGVDAAALAFGCSERSILVAGNLDFPRLIFAGGHPPPVVLNVERRQPCGVERLLGDVLRVGKLGARVHGHIVLFDMDDERVRPLSLRRP